MDIGIGIAFAALTALGIALHLALPRLLALRGIWFTWRTRFGPALVFDSEDADGTAIRLLNVNGTYQSVCYVDEELRWVPTCAYHRTWAQELSRRWDGAPARGEGRRRVLVMGGGGYSFPKWLVTDRPDVRCEVVEIDPTITRIARERFFLDELLALLGDEAPDRLALVTDDAWAHLQADADGYDVIVNDAFSGRRPLGRLGTREGASVIRAHLRPGGVYLGNIRCPLEGRGAAVLEETRRAFEDVFLHVRVIPERPEEPRRLANNTLLAW